MYNKYLTLIVASILSCSLVAGRSSALENQDVTTKTSKKTVSSRKKSKKRGFRKSQDISAVTDVEENVESTSTHATVPVSKKQGKGSKKRYNSTQALTKAEAAKAPDLAETTAVEKIIEDKASSKKDDGKQTTVTKIETAKALERLPEAASTVTVKNNITKKMITYTYMFVPYTPTLFTLTVNGKEMQLGEKAAITAPNGRLEIVYYAEFKNGYRKTSKKFVFHVKSNKKPVSLTFNWHKDQTVLADNADIESITTLVE